MKIRITILLLLFNLSIPALFSSDLSFNGYVRNYMGVLTNEDLDFAIVQNTFDLKMEYSIGNAAFFVNPWVNYNKDNSLDTGLREAYLDIYLDQADFRIGLQQVTWGKSDGVFITDVVSPKNLQEFLLPDFEEIRIGVNALKTDYYMRNSTIELIWVPTFTANIMPGADSIWNVNNLDFSDSEDSVEIQLENSEFFGRYSLMTSFVDIELMGAYMWDDEPTITSMAPFELEHNRLVMGGGSFSSVIGGFIFRGEGAFYSGKHYQALPSDPIEKNYVHYLIGLDYKRSGWNFSTQYIQEIILDYDDQILRDQFYNTLTFLVNKDFLRETLRLELFTYVELNDLNALMRPKIIYDISDGLSLLLGANIFLGEEGTFGQFHDNNMIYTKLKFSY